MEKWFTENQTANVKFSIRIKELLYSEKSPFQNIEVYDTYEFGKLLAIDNYIMLTEKDEFIYHEMITAVPMMVHPKIKDVLIIGGGDGGTVRELTKYKSIENITLVEIDNMVVKVSKKYFPKISMGLCDNRVNILYEDGIKYLQNKEEQYDLIIIDSTDPVGPGEGLFSLKFYQEVHKALKKDGIFVNQCESPYYETYATELIKAFNNIKNVFPIAKVYQYNIPTYASGHWVFGFGSKKYDPIKDFNKNSVRQCGLDFKYYNEDLHIGAFALPTYVKNMLQKESYNLNVSK